MGKRTRSDYESIIRLVYEGYTGEGISAIVGRNPGNISAMLADTGLTFKQVRILRRAGKPLGELLSSVDWSFLDKKWERLKSAHEAGTRNLRKHHEAKKSSVNDIAEMKRMLSEIHEVLLNPTTEEKPGIINRLATSWRTGQPQQWHSKEQ